MVGPGVVATSGDSAYKALNNNTNSTWWKDAGLRRLNLGILFMFGSAAANGFDGSLMNGLLAIPAFNANLGNVDKNILGLIIAGISLGGLPSFIPASYFTDHFGRKYCVGLGSSLMAVASLIQCFTRGPWAFLATRILLGIGLGFSQTAAPPLVTEIAHPRQRAQVTNLFQAIWYWGAIVSALATLGCLWVNNSWSWRAPCLLQAFFPLVQTLGLFIIPESPRWLISKGRNEEALEILARCHANGDTNDELVLFEYQETCEAIQFEKEATKSVGFSSFLKTRGNRHRLLICILVGVFIQWAGNGIVSYYLAPILNSVGITSSVDKASINLGLQIWNAILAFFGALAAETYGRRPLWLLSASGMLVSFIVITALSATFAEHHIQAAGTAVVAFLFIFFGFYDIAFTPLSIAYPVEILPFGLRAKGLSINLTIVFGAGFFNQYVNPIALAKLAWKFYFVYIACLACMIITIYFLFPETKGRTLEEIAVVFDGEKSQTTAEKDARRTSITRNEEMHNKGTKGMHFEHKDVV